MPSLSLWIGLRYLRAKRRHGFIGFIAGVAMLGIALGVAVLITVLSVTNGFHAEIKQRIFGMADHITVMPYQQKTADWQQLRQQVLKMPEIIAAAPIVQGQAMLSAHGRVHSVQVKGISPKLQGNVSILPDHMKVGSLQALQAGRFGVVLGRQLAQSLQVSVGDQVTIVVPRAKLSILGINPVFKRLYVVGIFEIGNGFGFDSYFAYLHWQDAQKLWGTEQHTGLQLKVHDLYQAPRIAHALLKEVDEPVHVSNWTQQFGALFKAIAMEKNMLFLILLLIIAVAVFNLVSALVMLVIDKRRDIAILRTLGVTPRQVMLVFMIQGTLTGVIGTVLGLIAGIALASHVTAVVMWLQSLLNIQLISANVYYLDYLPSQILMSDLIMIAGLSCTMSWLATLYPAWRATRVQPAEVLRYE